MSLEEPLRSRVVQSVLLVLTAVSIPACASTGQGTSGSGSLDYLLPPAPIEFQCSVRYIGPAVGEKIDLTPGGLLSSWTFGRTGGRHLYYTTEDVRFVGRTGERTLEFTTQRTEQNTDAPGTKVSPTERLAVYVSDTTASQKIGALSGVIGLSDARVTLTVTTAPRDTSYACGT